MVEGERFVRYDAGTPKETAPGGGKVAMHAQALEVLYGSMEAQPRKYVQGGRYRGLRQAARGAPGWRSKRMRPAR